MLDQFMLDRRPYAPNPEPAEPIPWPEGHALTLVSVEASAQEAEASPEANFIVGTKDGMGATSSSGDVFTGRNPRFNHMQGFMAPPFARQRFAEWPSSAAPADM